MIAEILTLPRRAFVRLGIGLGFGSAAGLAAVPGFAKAVEGYRPQILTEPELVALIAMMSRLIPADEGQGGAVEACAYIYVDRALAGYHARHLAAYRTGLAALDEEARKARHAGFAAMPVHEMDDLIARLEKGALPGGQFAEGGRSFFNLVRRHTVEGFLCDPMYGGNRDFLGWELLGFPGVQLYYSPETQRLNGKDNRPHRSIADFGGEPMP